MRLLHTDGENPTGEIKTFEPIAGVYDAVRIASQQGGDGTYWIDTGSGKYYEFVIQDGKAHGLTEDGWREGAPADIFDNSELEHKTQQPASQFGGFFMEQDEPVAPAEGEEPPARGNDFAPGVE